MERERQESEKLWSDAEMSDVDGGCSRHPVPHDPSARSRFRTRPIGVARGPDQSASDGQLARTMDANSTACWQLIHLGDCRDGQTVRAASSGPENCSKTRLRIGHAGSPWLHREPTNYTPAARVIGVQSTPARCGRKTLGEHARAHAQLLRGVERA